MRPQRQEILVKVRLGSCIHTLKYFFFNVKIHNLKWKLKSKGWLRRRARAKRWKDSSWLDDEEAREEFWLDAWRVWGCRRPAGAEGRVESSFGPSPRENVSHCQRGKMEEREWRWKWEVRKRKEKTGRLGRRRRTQTGEKVGRRGAASAPESMRLDDGRSEETTSYFDGVAVFWMLEHGDMQSHWKSCGSTSQSRHKHTLWMHKQTETHSLSFKLLFCNWWLLGICW